jgi:hypothetical protein
MLTIQPPRWHNSHPNLGYSWRPLWNNDRNGQMVDRRSFSFIFPWPKFTHSPTIHHLVTAICGFSDPCVLTPKPRLRKNCEPGRKVGDSWTLSPNWHRPGPTHRGWESTFQQNKELSWGWEVADAHHSFEETLQINGKKTKMITINWFQRCHANCIEQYRQSIGARLTTLHAGPSHNSCKPVVPHKVVAEVSKI